MFDGCSRFWRKCDLTEGLVLQEKKAWEELIGREVKTAANNAELYFEENDMDGLIKKLGIWQISDQLCKSTYEQNGE